jgi:hypothetical protein
VPDRAPDGNVVAHDNKTPDSDASGPVDINETHSTVVHHPSPTGTTMSVLTGKIHFHDLSTDVLD